MIFRQYFFTIEHHLRIILCYYLITNCSLVFGRSSISNSWIQKQQCDRKIYTLIISYLKKHLKRWIMGIGFWLYWAIIISLVRIIWYFIGFHDTWVYKIQHCPKETSSYYYCFKLGGWWKSEVQSQKTFESGNIRLGIMCGRFIWCEGPTILTDHQTLTQKPTLTTMHYGLCKLHNLVLTTNSVSYVA